MRLKIFIYVYLFTLALISPIAKSAATDTECTGSWCDGFGWIDNLSDKKWWMERINKAGKSLEATAKERIEGIIKDAALSYLQQYIPFLSPGSSGPSQLDLAVEKILSAIEGAETNIIDAIVAESVAQNGIDWKALKFDSAYYFSYPAQDRSTLYALLTSLLERSTTLRMEFQQDRTKTNPNRTFDTYNYDAFHTYLSLVALETTILIEHARMTKILSNPNVSDAEMQAQIIQDLQLLFDPKYADSPFTYVAWLDANKQKASDARFPESDLPTFVAEISTTSAADYARIGPYNRLFNDYCPDIFKYVKWNYSYLMDGDPYTVDFEKWLSRSSPPGKIIHCNVAHNNIPQPDMIFPYYPYINRGSVLWSYIGPTHINQVTAAVKLAIPLHKELAYKPFVVRGFGPARDILDGWWKLAGLPGNRPRLDFDRYLPPKPPEPAPVPVAPTPNAPKPPLNSPAPNPSNVFLPVVSFNGPDAPITPTSYINVAWSGSQPPAGYYIALFDEATNNLRIQYPVSSMIFDTLNNTWTISMFVTNKAPLGDYRVRFISNNVDIQFGQPQSEIFTVVK